VHPDIVITDEAGGSANLVRDVIKAKPAACLLPQINNSSLPLDVPRLCGLVHPVRRQSDGPAYSGDPRMPHRLMPVTGMRFG